MWQIAGSLVMIPDICVDALMCSVIRKEASLTARLTKAKSTIVSLLVQINQDYVEYLQLAGSMLPQPLTAIGCTIFSLLKVKISRRRKKRKRSPLKT